MGIYVSNVRGNMGSGHAAATGTSGTMAIVQFAAGNDDYFGPAVGIVTNPAIPLLKLKRLSRWWHSSKSTTIPKIHLFKSRHLLREL